MSQIKTAIVFSFVLATLMYCPRAGAQGLCETEQAKQRFPAVVLEYVSLNSAIERNSLEQFHASAEKILVLANEMTQPQVIAQRRGLASIEAPSPRCLDIGKILSDGVRDLVGVKDIKEARSKVTAFGQIMAMWTVLKSK